MSACLRLADQSDHGILVRGRAINSTRAYFKILDHDLNFDLTTVLDRQDYYSMQILLQTYFRASAILPNNSKVSDYFGSLLHLL